MNRQSQIQWAQRVRRGAWQRLLFIWILANAAAGWLAAAESRAPMGARPPGALPLAPALREPSEIPSVTTNGETTVWLQWHESARSTWHKLDFNLTHRSAPFKKEPALGAGKIHRGVISLVTSRAPGIPFLWDQSAAKLYLDLNRNEDLTDDQAGEFTSALKRQYQVFFGITLTESTEHGPRRFRMHIRCSNYGAPLQLNVSTDLESYWQGMFEVQGRKYSIALAERPGATTKDLFADRSGSAYLVVRPYDERDQFFTTATGTLQNSGVFSYRSKIFLADQAYQIRPAFEGNGAATKLKLVLTELKPELGELKLTGTFIHELDLDGDYAVALRTPAAIVQVPVGSYEMNRVFLKGPGSNEFACAALDNRVAIAGGKPAVLEAGGPLRSIVAVAQAGRTLRLSYQLTGAGGLAYTVMDTDRSHPPTFEIYQGNKRLAGGKFEYG